MKSIHSFLLRPCMTLFFVLSFSLLRAERIYSVVFDELPKDKQLYARDDNYEATVPYQNRRFQKLRSLNISKKGCPLDIPVYLIH